MAIKYVWSGASGAANGTSWTDAYLTYSAALTGSTGADSILVAHDHSESTTSALSLAHPQTTGMLVTCVNRTTGDLATTASIAIGAASVGMTLSGIARIYGVQFLGATNNSSASSISIANSGSLSTTSLVFTNCLFNLRTVNTIPITIGTSSGTSGQRHFYVEMNSCTVSFGNAGQSLTIQGCKARFTDLKIASGSATPTNLFVIGSGINMDFEVYGSDLSNKSYTNLVTTAIYSTGKVKFVNCKLATAYAITFNASNIVPATTEVFLHDCSTGDVHGLFGYYNSQGSLVSDTGIYFTSGSAAQSWKLTTTANANYAFPFVSPWVSFWRSDLGSSFTPYFEILRDGSTTAYKDSEVYAEFAVKDLTTNSVTRNYNDSQLQSAAAIGTTGANQAAGAGLASWTGESGTAWSGKIDSGTTLTAQEIGELRGRICVPAPSITVYLNPEILIG